MKVQSSIKKQCDQCKVVRRRGALFIVCTKDPRHKRKQG